MGELINFDGSALGTIYLKTNSKERALVGNLTLDQSRKFIVEYCGLKKFVMHYMRVWNTPDGDIWFDVGSWSEFFIWRKDSKDD